MHKTRVIYAAYKYVILYIYEKINHMCCHTVVLLWQMYWKRMSSYEIMKSNRREGFQLLVSFFWFNHNRIWLESHIDWYDILEIYSFLLYFLFVLRKISRKLVRVTSTDCYMQGRFCYQPYAIFFTPSPPPTLYMPFHPIFSLTSSIVQLASQSESSPYSYVFKLAF